MRHRLLRVLAALGAALAVPAAAQDFMFDQTIDNFVSNQVTQLQLQNLRRSEAENGQAPFSAFGGTGAADLADVALDFSPRAELRREAVETLRRQVADASPEDADAIGPDVFAVMDGALRPYGMSTDDLGDATVVYMTTVHDAANGTSTQTSRDAARALRSQVGDAYAALAAQDPALLDPALRQEQSDQFLLQAFLIASMNESLLSGGTPAQKTAFRAAMRDLGQEVFGIDLTKATIDARGLVPGEATDALAAGAEQARAEGSATDAGTQGGPPCGQQPRDAVEARVMRYFERRQACASYDPQAYARFLEEVPRDQHYAVNFAAWIGGQPLFAPDQAAALDRAMD